MASVFALLLLVVLSSLAASMAVVAQSNLRAADGLILAMRAQGAAEDLDETQDHQLTAALLRLLERCDSLRRPALLAQVLDACERWDGGGVFDRLQFAIGASHAQTVACGDEDVALGVHDMGATAADAR
jgi:hypothetical protein